MLNPRKDERATSLLGFQMPADLGVNHVRKTWHKSPENFQKTKKSGKNEELLGIESGTNYGNDLGRNIEGTGNGSWMELGRRSWDYIGILVEGKEL